MTDALTVVSDPVALASGKEQPPRDELLRRRIRN